MGPEKKDAPAAASTNAINLHKYTLGVLPNSQEQRYQNGQQVLMKDGRTQFCHKIQPCIIPSPLTGGFAQVVPMPCNLDCSRAAIYEFNGKPWYQQSCDDKPVQFMLETTPIEPSDKKK